MLARAVIEAASRDSFSIAFRYPIVLFLCAYLLTVMLNTSRNSVQDGTLQYESPEFLRMQLRHAFPQFELHAHGIAGVALVIAAVTQKLLVPRMLKSSRARWLHGKVLGPFILACIAIMVTAGFSLRSASQFTSFETAMIWFGAPWVTLFFLTGISAKLRMWRLHAVCGDAVVKACVAVPLARLTGAVLQRWQAFMTDEQGYYYGIALASVVVGIWAVADAYTLLDRVRKVN
jgi:hypothetical protein